MITIKRFVFNDFQENTYVLHESTGECIIIDAGNYYPEENSALTGYIENNMSKPVRLLNTHCHIDHITGNLFIREKYGLKPEAHSEESMLISHAVSYAEVFGFTIQEPPVISAFLKDNDQVLFGNSILKVLHVPGHSRGSLAFYCKADGFVITGDVLFKGSIGRTDLPGGDFDTLIASIRNKLLVMPDHVIVYPGHGDKTNIRDERNNNPFLQ
ncbi:MAG: MBL fold metallo-hydrolase [Bacteroidia bacterium]|nr:MBL fold metallo-hydrolase [Bacteroidia bacterium]